MGLLRTDYAKLFLYDLYVKLFMNDPLQLKMEKKHGFISFR